MKTSVENLSPTRVKLTVNVPFEELKPSVEAATKKIAEQVQIPGFRKGKVPTRLVEQRFGRPAIMQEAVNDSLPNLYQQAALESKIRPAGQPEVEVSEVPGLDGSDEGDLVFVVEQDVRPQIELPEFSSVEVEIEEPEVDDDAVETRLTALRERFGTLRSVDRPAQDRDFVSLDMVAKIDGEEIETVEGVSYQIGEGNMLEGLDEALTGLSAEETTTFTAPLAGGERAGEEAEVTVTAKSVKERELPEADDEFAELASEFDTIAELKEDLKAQAEKDAGTNRVTLARNALLEKLLEDLEVPVPEKLVEDEIKAHLENEGKEAGDPHGEEIREDTEKAIRAQFVLDAILEGREVTVEQEDLTSYFTQMSLQYGIDANQLIQMFAQGGQLEQVFGEVQRSKALDAALAEVTVKNTDGTTLDLGLDSSDEAKAEDAADAAGDSAADAATEDKGEQKAEEKKAPAKKAPAKKSTSSTAKKSTSTAAKKSTSSTAKSSTAKSTAAKSSTTKSSTAKSSTAKSSTAKSSTAKSGASTAKKAPAKKSTAAAKKAEDSADGEK